MKRLILGLVILLLAACQPECPDNQLPTCDQYGCFCMDWGE